MLCFVKSKNTQSKRLFVCRFSPIIDKEHLLRNEDTEFKWLNIRKYINKTCCFECKWMYVLACIVVVRCWSCVWEMVAHFSCFLSFFFSCVLFCTNSYFSSNNSFSKHTHHCLLLWAEIPHALGPTRSFSHSPPLLVIYFPGPEI